MLKIQHKMDPRTKLVIVLCISTLAVVIQNIYILSAVFIATLIIAEVFRGDLFSATKKLKKIIWVVVMIAIVQSIFSPSGEILVALKSITILSTGGMIKGLEFILRMLTVVFSAVIITTSNSREIIQGLVQWKIPYEIAFMVSIGIRFLPMLTEEIKDAVTAIQLRGIPLDKIQLGKKIKIYSYIFMPVVAGTIIKAQKLSVAMEMRAFRAYPDRTSYMTLKMSHVDYIVISLSILTTLTIAVKYFNII